jgi:hypothetical protein
VVALREGDDWTAQSLRSVALEVPGLDRAVTDSAGAFAIELASPAARYDLVAGGQGYVCKTAVRGLLAGERHAVVRVERAYAVWLRIRESGGATPKLPGAFCGSRYGTARPVESSLTGLQGSAPQLALAVPAASLADSSLFDRLYTFLSPSAEAQVGPVQLLLDWPGYAKAELSFMVPAVDGPIENRRIELQPVSACRAPVHVSWTGLPLDLPVERSPEPSALLRFDSESTGSFDLAVRALSPQSTLLGELPCGSYRVWWTPGSLPIRGVPEGEPTRMDLGPEGFQLHFDLSGKGWVQIEFALPDGPLYSGKASILSGSGSSGSLSDGFAAPESRQFSGPPYLLGPLEPGAYFAYLDMPRMGDRSAGAAKAAAVDFEVLPGVVTGAASRLAGSR